MPKSEKRDEIKSFQDAYHALSEHLLDLEIYSEILADREAELRHGPKANRIDGEVRAHCVYKLAEISRKLQRDYVKFGQWARFYQDMAGASEADRKAIAEYEAMRIEARGSRRKAKSAAVLALVPRDVEGNA